MKRAGRRSVVFAEYMLWFLMTAVIIMVAVLVYDKVSEATGQPRGHRIGDNRGHMRAGGTADRSRRAPPQVYDGIARQEDNGRHGTHSGGGLFRQDSARARSRSV